MVVCITLLCVFLGFTSLGDTSCEAYKTQVINDCNSLIDNLQYTRGRVFDIRSSASGWLGYSNDVYQSSFQSIIKYADDAMARLDVNISQVNSIKSTAQSLTCSSSDGGSCDCDEVLGEINSKLGYIHTLVSSIAGSNHTDISSKLTQIINKLSSSSSSTNNVDLSTIEGYLADIKTAVSSILEYSEYIYTFLNDEVLDYFDAFKWFVGWGQSGASYSFRDLYNLVSAIGYGITNAYQTAALDRYARYYRYKGYSNNDLSFSYVEPHLAFRSSTQFKSSGIKFWLYMFGNEFIQQLSSLNNYQWANYQATGVLTNLVDSGFAAVTNTLVEQFSIFANDSPLKGNTEKPDKYYDYLTNYYIKVSVNPSGSASEPYTNWFNRIEMLLAALVFKTDKAVSNDFTTASAGAMEGSLSGALDNVRGIQDNSESVITTVEKSSRSLLTVMSQWDDKLTMAASLPSHIEFIDLGGAKDGGGSTNPSSAQSGSGSVDTKIGIDLSSGPLKLFVDSCRSITTLCWVFVFLFSGWGVARFMVSKFLTIIKLCYVIFKTALGLG